MLARMMGTASTEQRTVATAVDGDTETVDEEEEEEEETPSSGNIGSAEHVEGLRTSASR